MHEHCDHDEGAEIQHETALNYQVSKEIEQRMMRAKMFSEFKKQDFLQEDP